MGMPTYRNRAKTLLLFKEESPPQAGEVVTKRRKKNV